jgi:DNA repair protein RadC
MGKIKGTTALLPREKATSLGISCLSDWELVALLLDTGTQKENVLLLSQRLLNENGGLVGLMRASERDLSISGIKKAKACRILALGEVYKRLPLTATSRILTVEDSLRLTQRFFQGQKTENVVILFLAKDRTVLGIKHFTGKSDEEISFSWENLLVGRKEEGVRFVLIIHNHPSQAVLPSAMDNKSTLEVCQYCDREGMVLLDSLIVSDDSFFSFRRSGFFKKDPKK